MVGLDAVNKGGCRFSGKVRILRVILKVTSAKGRTFNVYRGPKDNGYIGGLSFFAYSVAKLAEQFTVKGAGAEYSRREAYGFPACAVREGRR